MEKERVPIEEAINRAGFGVYSLLMTGLAGVAIMSFSCIAYGITILLPTSACELETTPAQQGILAAGPVIGSIVGVVMWGYLADTRGRKNMMMVSLVTGAAVNCLASISVNWIMLLILQFIACVLSSGLYSIAMTLLSESVPMARRNLVVLLVTSIFLLSQGLMAVVAIPVIPLSFSHYLPALDIYWNSWRLLVIVYSVPSLISVVWLFFMKESPKFVFSRGDEQQALEIIRTIHRVNHIFSSGKELQVNGILKEEVKMTAQNTVEKQLSPMKQLFSQPHLKNLIIMTILMMFQQIGAFVVWLPTVANQFVNIVEVGEGTDLNLCRIIQLGTAGDPDAVPCALNNIAMLVVFGVGALQSIVNLFLSVIVNYTGRRNIVFALTSICGVAGIVVNLVPNAIGSFVLYTIMMQGFIILGMYTAIIVAIFPTQLRAVAIAIPQMFDRLMTFAAIQILNLMLNSSCEAGFYLFSTIFASSAIVAAFLPDDRKLRPPTPPAPTSPSPHLNDKAKERDISQL